ncbi:MAG: hypothetical protein MUE85_10900 [Microscillaceae bacterium]|jgi:hypothetical protein|nr:hypothetical protein [Microscillaceae bacterium]
MKDFIVICLILVGLTTCNRNPLPENFVSFELDGVLWESASVTTRVLDVGSLFEVEIIAINAKQERLRLKVYSLTGKGVGSYFSDSFGNTLLQYARSGDFGALDMHRTGASCVGSIIINAYEPGVLQGSFSGTLCTGNGNQIIIRNGTLNRLRFF